MNIVRYLTSPLTNAIYEFFNWNGDGNPEPINIPLKSILKTKSLLNKHNDQEKEQENESDLDFDQKLINRKNFNQKRNKQPKYNKKR